MGASRSSQTLHSTGREGSMSNLASPPGRGNKPLALPVAARLDCQSSGSGRLPISKTETIRRKPEDDRSRKITELLRGWDMRRMTAASGPPLSTLRGETRAACGGQNLGKRPAPDDVGGRPPSDAESAGIVSPLSVPVGPAAASLILQTGSLQRLGVGPRAFQRGVGTSGCCYQY